MIKHALVIGRFQIQNDQSFSYLKTYLAIQNMRKRLFSYNVYIGGGEGMSKVCHVFGDSIDIKQ